MRDLHLRTVITSGRARIKSALTFLYLRRAMASKVRLQVLLSEEAGSKVRALADKNGISVSAMCSQLISTALRLPRYNEKSRELQGDYTQPSLTKEEMTVILKLLQSVRGDTES